MKKIDWSARRLKRQVHRLSSGRTHNHIVVEYGDLLGLVVGQRLLQLRLLGGGPNVRGDAVFRLLRGQGGGKVELVDVRRLGAGERDVEGLEGALHGGGPLSRIQVLVGPFLEVVGHVVLAIWGMS